MGIFVNRLQFGRAAQAGALCGVPPDSALDATVFSSPAAPLLAVYVAGQAVHTAPKDEDGFAQTMRDLLAG